LIYTDHGARSGLDSNQNDTLGRRLESNGCQD
jgi:hypothetical protein